MHALLMKIQLSFRVIFRTIHFVDGKEQSINRPILWLIKKRRAYSTTDTRHNVS